MRRAGHTKWYSQLVTLSRRDRKDRVEMNHSVSQPRTELQGEEISKARHPPKMGVAPKHAHRTICLALDCICKHSRIHMFRT